MSSKCELLVMLPQFAEYVRQKKFCKRICVAFVPMSEDTNWYVTGNFSVCTLIQGWRHGFKSWGRGQNVIRGKVGGTIFYTWGYEQGNKYHY